MQADRSGCSSAPEDVQRILMIILLSDDHPRWSRAELERALSRPGGGRIAVDDAIGVLYRVGLVHVSDDDLIEPTQAARYLDDLLGKPI